MNDIGTASLRVLTAGKLREMTEPMTVTYHGKPIAAVVPYALYLEMQRMVKNWKDVAAERS
jgi:antitoxin (DNA-binding transcriptional repressor) of toxin-antitoxin stability system